MNEAKKATTITIQSHNWIALRKCSTVYMRARHQIVMSRQQKKNSNESKIFLSYQAICKSTKSVNMTYWETKCQIFHLEFKTCAEHGRENRLAKTLIRVIKRFHPMIKRFHLRKRFHPMEIKQFEFHFSFYMCVLFLSQPFRFGS